MQQQNASWQYYCRYRNLFHEGYHQSSKIDSHLHEGDGGLQESGHFSLHDTTNFTLKNTTESRELHEYSRFSLKNEFSWQPKWIHAYSKLILQLAQIDRERNRNYG